MAAGTPWKARPVQLPSGRQTRTQGRCSISSAAPVSTESLLLCVASSSIYCFSSAERGVSSRYSRRIRGEDIRANTVWSWASDIPRKKRAACFGGSRRFCCPAHWSIGMDASLFLHGGGTGVPAPWAGKGRRLPTAVTT